MPTQPTAKKAVAKKVAAPKGGGVTEPQAPYEPDASGATTVASVTHEPANRPDSFAALKKDELVVAAQHFGTEDEGSDVLIRADLEANGITWNMYKVAFKLPGWEDVPASELHFDGEGGPDTPRIVELTDDDDETEVQTVETIVTQSPVPSLEEGKYLIKFVGSNWYFEHGKYSFTKDNPYALMPAHDAQDALVNEPTKFRQAFPAELSEYQR